MMPLSISVGVLACRWGVFLLFPWRACVRDGLRAQAQLHALWRGQRDQPVGAPSLFARTAPVCVTPLGEREVKMKTEGRGGGRSGMARKRRRW